MADDDDRFDDNDIREVMGRYKDSEAPAPRETMTGLRGEFTTRIRTNQPRKPGCPLFAVMSLGTIWLILSWIF